MLDELLCSSFELDFEILSTVDNKFRKITSRIDCPKLESSNILLEYENYVNFASECYNELLRILQRCDEQRKNFRVITIKQSKEKTLIDKLLKEEDCSLTINKLLIQDELKNQIIDNNLNKLKEKDTIISDLKTQLEFYTSTYTSFFSKQGGSTNAKTAKMNLQSVSTLKNNTIDTSSSLSGSLMSLHNAQPIMNRWEKVTYETVNKKGAIGMLMNEGCQLSKYAQMAYENTIPLTSTNRKSMSKSIEYSGMGHMNYQTQENISPTNSISENMENIFENEYMKTDGNFQTRSRHQKPSGVNNTTNTPAKAKTGNELKCGMKKDSQKKSLVDKKTELISSEKSFGTPNKTISLSKTSNLVSSHKKSNLKSILGKQKIDGENVSTFNVRSSAQKKMNNDAHSITSASTVIMSEKKSSTQNSHGLLVKKR